MSLVPGIGELPIHNDEGRTPRVFTSVTSERVNHYDDIIEYMVKTEVNRCKGEGFTPSQSQIDFLKKELIRHAVIRRDVMTAQKIRIAPTQILKS